MCGQNVTFQPRDGRWNMKNKTLYRPAKILGCAITIYDQRFGPTHEQHLKESLFNVAQTLGIRSMPPDPPVLRKNATGSAYWKVSGDPNAPLSQRLCRLMMLVTALHALAPERGGCSPRVSQGG